MNSAPDSHQADSLAVIVHPALLLLGALVAPLVLNLVKPLPFLESALLMRGVIAVALGAFAAAAVVLSFRELRANHTAVEPTLPATTLVRTGPYRFSRNPAYLAQLAFIGAAAFAFDSAWLLVVIPILAIALLVFVIVPEEHHLEARFGADYQAYRAAVRRWI